jgi:hypothetical protein
MSLPDDLIVVAVNRSFGGIGVSILVFTTRKVTTPFPKTDAILSLEKVVKEDWFRDIGQLDIRKLTRQCVSIY